jgi:hypothetical protein
MTRHGAEGGEHHRVIDAPRVDVLDEAFAARPQLGLAGGTVALAASRWCCAQDC